MKYKSVKQTLKLGLLSLLALIALSSSKVYATTLAELLVSGAEYPVADKIFYDFHAYSSAGIGGASAVTPDLITVEGRIDSINNVQEYGLLFHVFNMQVGESEGKDIRFEFSVRTASGLDLIIDDYLEMNGGADGAGTAAISETVVDENYLSIPSTDRNGDPLATASLYVYQTNRADVTTDTANFNQPQNILHVRKDIYVFGGLTQECSSLSTPCSAFISDFSQLFSQIPPDHDIPEPSSMILLGLGLVGLRFVQRKRAAK